MASPGGSSKAAKPARGASVSKPSSHLGFPAFVAAAAAALTACATLPARPRLGDVTVRSKENPQAAPITLGVQEGRILSGDLDLVVDPDGCVRGTVGTRMLSLCQQPPAPDASSQPGAHREKWTGSSGSFTLEVDPDGRTMRADGFLRGVGSRTAGTVTVAATLPFGKGPQWEELKAHPALYAIAAALSGARGDSVQVVEEAAPDAGTPAAGKAGPETI